MEGVASLHASEMTWCQRKTRYLVFGDIMGFTQVAKVRLRILHILSASFVKDVQILNNHSECDSASDGALK